MTNNKFIHCYAVGLPFCCAVLFSSEQFSSVQFLFIFQKIQFSYSQHKDIETVLQIYIYKNI